MEEPEGGFDLDKDCSHRFVCDYCNKSKGLHCFKGCSFFCEECGESEEDMVAQNEKYSCPTCGLETGRMPWTKDAAEETLCEVCYNVAQRVS